MADTLQASTAEELRELIAAACADEKPLEIIGTGSKRGLGRPVEAQAEVSLEQLAGIDLYEPDELVMAAAAGTPLAEVEKLLDDNQQQLAFEPADYGAILGGEPGRGTIGAVFACNLSGPRRLKAGAARDHFLGLSAVTGRGDLIKSGGRVMKNVTGYDLAKLLAGSFGTLAVMTQVTFKVLPAPEASATLVLGGLDAETGGEALRHAIASPYEIAGAAYLPAAAGARSAVGAVSQAGSGLALIRIEGTRPSIDYRLGVLEQIVGSFGADLMTLGTEPSVTLWREIRDGALLAREATLWRLSVAPAAGPALADRLASRLELDYLLDWGGGLVWLALAQVTDGGAAAVRAEVASVGGHATLIRAAAALRTRIPVFEPQPDPLARLSARVKHSFDPKRILNRGRMYAGT